MKLLKRIEINLRKRINKLLNSGSLPVLISSPELVLNLGDYPKIMVLRHDRIGDVLVSIPFFKLLRKRFPKARIDIILGKKNQGCRTALLSYFNNILIYEKNIFKISGMLFSIRQTKYDLIIDPFDKVSSTSNLFVKFSKAALKLSIDKENSSVYTHVVPLRDKNKYHVVERTAALLLAFGIEPKNSDLSLEYTIMPSILESAKNKLPPKEHFRIGINLFGSDRTRFWGLENNSEFIKIIKEKQQNCEILILTTPKYQYELSLLTQNGLAKAAPFADSLDEYAAMLSTCDMIITPDTSAIHFAAAYKIPCISLFKSSNKENGLVWSSYQPNSQSIISGTQNICDISVAIVMEAFDRINCGANNYNDEAF
ncbi:MAG: family 9 glycosyl transferase [Ignavibacteria bacterium]|nr:family 9 glycosyl transferase [Ignavibacteria bacterium]